MNPTPRLRFVERVIDVKEGDLEYREITKVLQQWFAYDIDYPATKGEWKDVPTVEEKDVKTF